MAISKWAETWGKPYISAHFFGLLLGLSWPILQFYLSRAIDFLPGLSFMKYVWNLPNLLSLARLLATPVCAWFVLMPDWYGRLASLVLFTLAALTDFWDGKLARRTAATSEMGAFLDPLADKCMVLTMYATFWWLRLLPLVPLLVVAVRDIVVTWLRMRQVARAEKKFSTLWLAQLKTTVQFGALYGAYVLLLWPTTGVWCQPLTNACVYLMAMLSLYTGLHYVAKSFWS